MKFLSARLPCCQAAGWAVHRITRDAAPEAMLANAQVAEGVPLRRALRIEAVEPIVHVFAIEREAPVRMSEIGNGVIAHVC